MLELAYDVKVFEVQGGLGEQATIPFGEEELAYINQLDPAADIQMLRQELPALRDECLCVLEVPATASSQVHSPVSTLFGSAGWNGVLVLLLKLRLVNPLGCS